MSSLFTIGGDKKKEQAQQQHQAQSKERSQKEQQHVTQELGTKVSSLNRRLVTIEDRYRNLRTQRQFNEQDSLRSKQKLLGEIDALDAQMKEMHHSLSDVSGKITTILRELESCAKREEVAAVKKYVELFEPLSFLTVEDAKKMIQEAYHMGQKQE